MAQIDVGREVPGGTELSQSSRYVPALDGIRAVAVLSVVAYHFLPHRAPGGFLGVDVFFVLSGYLITSLLLRELAAQGVIHLGHFFVRRLRRLLPASLAVLTTAVVVTWLTADPIIVRSVSRDALYSLANVANWRFIFSDQGYVENFLGIEPSPLRHMWSLAVEEQFYLVWPFVVVAVGMVARSRGSLVGARRGLLWITMAGVVASATWMGVLSGVSADINRVYYGTDTRVHMILFGALLAAMPASRVARIARQRHLLLVIQTGGLASFAVFITQGSTETMWLYRGGFILVAVMVVVVIVSCIDTVPHPIARLLAIPPLVIVGRLSYSLYLWHWPMVIWIDEDSTGWSGESLLLLLVRCAATGAASIVSYVLIEQPIRRRGLAFLSERLRPMAVISVVTSLALLTWLFPFRLPVGGGIVLDPVEQSAGQLVASSYAESKYRCDLPATSSSAEGLTVFTVGNSLVREIEPCLGEVLQAQGGELVSMSNNADAICDVAARLETQPLRPRGQRNVVIFFHLPFWITPCGLQVGEDQRERVYVETLDSLVTEWSQRGFVTLFVVPPPGVGGIEDPAHRRPLETVANRHRDRVRFIDAGRYMRLTTGEYVEAMPCLASEPGCSPEGAIAIRFPRDNFHYCSWWEWKGDPCPSDYAGGPRRVAASVAEELFALLR